MASSADTIFAPASGAGRAGVAVMRISGPAAGAALTSVAGADLPEPRRAVLARFRDPAGGETLDRGLALWFPAPHSYTGEDVAELHLHGSRAVLAGIAEALAAMPGLRPAEPGEFSRRAFLNGKLDLTEAEAIADLVEAETAAQRRQALRQMAGGLAGLYDGWRTRLMRSLAHLEADLDFPDEDLPDGVAALVRPGLSELAGEIAAHLADGRRGERLRDGIRIAILGPPNAGKSSLLNALARREAAIVAETAGTTRDVIEVHLDLAGYPVVLADTAGLRAAADAVEDEGVRRALARAADADLRLLVFDGRSWPALDAATLALAGEEALVVLNKADLAESGRPGEAAGMPALSMSAKTGEGVDRLVSTLTRRVAERFADLAAMPPTRARHRAGLEDCIAALDRALAAPAPELAAEDVRLAMRALGRITGAVDVEDLLDIVFRDFCIGK